MKATTKPTRVLVVDDSAFNRKTLTTLLSTIAGVEVVGKAGDGDEALRLVNELEPDLITLDLEMPRMDGFTFLRLLMARRPTPVIVVSGYSAKENVFRALEMGALDFIAKPPKAGAGELDGIRDELAEKVGLVTQLTPAGLDPRKRSALLTGATPPATSTPPPRERETTRKMWTGDPTLPKKILVIGASTGGPTALLEVFSRLPANASLSVIVAQHMPERFTRAFAERLDRLGILKVCEAQSTSRIQIGVGYVCPGGNCIELTRDTGSLLVRVVPPEPKDRFIPSVDRLFESAAVAAGQRIIAVVLTGMGDDGARGVVSVKDSGGTVLAEAPDTAVIYGMPGSAVRTGKVDRSLPLRALAEHVAELAS